MTQKNNMFLLKLKTFCEFIISMGAFYLVFNFPIPLFPSLVVICVAIFSLAEALGGVDKINGYGKKNNYYPPNNNNNHTQEHLNPQEENEMPEEYSQEPTQLPDEPITDNDDENFLYDDSDDEIIIPPHLDTVDNFLDDSIPE